MNLEIEHTQTNGTRELSVTGEIDAYTAPQLRDELLPLTEQKDVTVSADLSGVQYMDSTGLGIFVAALKSSKKHGSHLKINGVTPRVKRLFDITGLSEIIEIDKTNGVKGGTT
ncbi:MAG TPA: STAS domain-containing protein [Bacillales bacterium]|nr:STAS domain-containing protein [Bacillales bacterium]